MANLIAFINQFLEYLVVFGTAIVLVLIGVFAGTTLRKQKNAKAGTDSDKD